MMHFYFEFTYIDSIIFGEIEAENETLAKEALLHRYKGFHISDPGCIHLWMFSDTLRPHRDLVCIRNIHPCDIGSPPSQGMFIGPPRHSKNRLRSELISKGVHGLYITREGHKEMKLKKRIADRRLYLLSKRGITS